MRDTSGTSVADEKVPGMSYENTRKTERERNGSQTYQQRGFVGFPGCRGKGR
jgi:hypothetical protein